MPSCPSCAASVPDGSRFCPACGFALGPVTTRAETAVPASDDVTRAAGLASPPPAHAVTGGATPFARELPDAYTAGTVLARRYRIVGLLGRGGMGEVYRADDLTLGQSVALKFLPRAVSRDPARLAGLIDEVRAARQVSHPNVCRVYDVGETDDAAGGSRWFLTMEYVDGEDLATSLRRIGRFPVDKGLEIARQLCAGLAAIHEKGLVHRDLKPANVMLDGRGQVRITDFGLAGEFSAAGDASGPFAGTPAYMAPELLRGEPATARSDIYALGLVLYEVFTGRRAFDAATILELREQQQRGRPASLSSSAGQIDPAIEEAVFRCLDPDPARRPSSPIAVAAALPGGDPLGAALAAGETPSPAMVAAAGENQGLTPRAAVALLGAFIVLLGICVALVAVDGFTRYVRLPYPPAVLENKAADIATSFGWTAAPADTARMMYWDADYLQFVNRARREPGRWAAMREDEPGVLFFYRAAESPLVPTDFSRGATARGRVGFTDPPPVRVGDRRVWLDPHGRLTRFEAVPPQTEEAAGARAPEPQWDRVFQAAGLDPARFTPAEPAWVPLAMADARAAWTGSIGSRPDVPLRLEAAAFRGRIVFARVVGPWTRPERQDPPSRSASEIARNLINLAVMAVLVVGALLLARHNLALDRADRRGAGRLGVLVFGLMLAGWALQADHVFTRAGAELMLLMIGTSAALFSAAAAWLLYVALEPFVRRRWPHTVIGWNRLLAGRLRDGIVGRDILVGGVLGAGLAALFFVTLGLGRMIGPLDPEPITPALDPLLGTRYVGAAFVNLLSDAILQTLTVYGIYLLLLLLLRRSWLAVAIAVSIVTTINALGAGNPLLMGSYAAIVILSGTFVLFRFGLVAFAVSNLVLRTLGGGFPLSVDPAHWCSGASLAVLVGLVAAAVAGFRLSLGGRPLFGRPIE